MEQIRENFVRIRKSLPREVKIVAAAKTRTPSEVAEVIEAGADIIGENYVQEAERIQSNLSPELLAKTKLHMIGHLQRNKVNKALSVFDAIQSIDSLKVAEAVNKRCECDRPIPVLVQVNIAGEESKYGIPPDQLPDILSKISRLDNLKVRGLMTMEPYYSDPELARPHFREMKKLFDRAAGLDLEGVDMGILSMGMTNSYRVAVEEGANMVRIGTAIFGPRD